MAGCSPFRVAFKGDPTKLFEKAMKLANANGVNVNGDEVGGSFTATAPIGGRIAGSYRVIGQDLEVSIAEKPFMLPCSMIETLLRQAIN